MACPKNTHIYSVLEPRKLRTKSGCLACRARRKKCDEQRPVCGACDRLQLNCFWPAPPYNEPPILESVPTPDPQPIQPSQVSATTETSDILQSVSSFDPDGDDLDILGSPKEALFAELRELEQHLREGGIFPCDTILAPGAREQIVESEGPETAILFDHFCHKTAPWLVNGYCYCYDNPALKHIIPLTITDDLVLRTVLAISGIHLHHSTPSIASLAMKYYSYALDGLKKRLSDWLSSSNEDYKPLFATIILLCHCEVSMQNSVAYQNSALRYHSVYTREYQRRRPSTSTSLP